MICDNGKYSNNRAIQCISCPKGKYNFGTYDDEHKSCLNCDIGTFNELIGSDNINNCLNCPLGKFSNMIGLNNSIGCNSCNVGKYNEILGSTKMSDCIDCPAGKLRQFVAGTSINDCVDCTTGYFSNSGSFECKECLAGKYNNINGNNICLDCIAGMYNNNTKSVICNECPDNSESNIKFSICECIKGTYMTSREPLVCNTCPLNFECFKGSTIETIIVVPTFWRANSTTLHTERCKKAYNCPGGILNTSSNDLCNIGHTGPICDVCLDGWAKNEGKCFKCMTDENIIARSYTFTILFPLIIAAIIFFMIKTANPSSSTAQKEPLSGVIKIFMNYAQIFTLASSFEINWPKIILILFDRTKEFSSPRISFYSSDCTIGWDYYTKLLAYMLLPLGYILIVTLILSIYTFVFYKKNRNKVIALEKWKDKRKYYLNNPEPMIFFKSWMCTSILIGLFLAWPTIIKQSLSIIPCKKYGNMYYLLQDLSIECYTTEHYIYSIMSSIFLVIYGFIVPILAFLLIRTKRFSLYDFNSKYEMPGPLSFLFLGYREQVWYYEFIVMAKKYVLILITVFLKEYSRYQMISASLFIQASFFIHVFLRPYDGITNYGILCNKLESISLLALVVTLNSGLFFGTIDQQYDIGFFEMVLIGILFTMNALVVIYFLYYLLLLGFNEIVDMVKKAIKSLDKNKSCCSCCLNCLADGKREKIIKWSRGISVDTYGINLQSDEEVELFHHFFNDKNLFSNKLKQLLKDKKLKNFNHILNRIKCNIEIIEKQRCWLSILNNRLYKKLRQELSNNKDKLESRVISKLNNILSNYIKTGLKYSKTIDRISEKTLVSIRRNSIILENIYEESSENETSDDSEVEEVYDIKNIVI